MDSILNTISLFLTAIWNVLVYVFYWFIPTDGSLTQIVLSVFKVGAVIVLLFILFDNSRNKRY